MLNWELREIDNLIWLYIPLLIAAVCIIFVRSYNELYIPFLFKAVFNNSSINLYAKQDLQTGKIFSYLLLFVNGIALSIAFYITLKNQFLFEYKWSFFGFLFLSFFIFFIYKRFTIAFLGWISESKKQLEESKLNLFVVYEAVSIIAICLSFIVLLTSYEIRFILSWGIIVLQILAYLFILFQGILHAIKNKISFVYIFLYLCTLEILPLVVIFYALSV